jgi:oligopeptide transport system permease protein
MNAVPGGPFLGEKAVTEAVMKALEAKYGLDKPLGEQYLTYLKGIITFDFGPSLKLRGKEVIDIISVGFKTSAKIGGIAAVLAVILGVTLGSIAAIKRNKFTDKTIMVLSTAFVATPSFIIASFFLIIFCVNYQIFPARGDTTAGLIVPIIALSLYPMSYITRLTRSSMLEVLGQDYIRTARAKGVKSSKVIFKHALKNALIPVLTYIGPMLAYILTGSLVVERIFSVPGLGRSFVNSITNRDYTLIMGTTIFLASLIVILNLVTDILYKLVDPRIDFS